MLVEPATTSMGTISGKNNSTTGNNVLTKLYLYDIGKITKVTNFMGIIRFKCNDGSEPPAFDECLFFLNSYHLKPVRTLCQVFTVGDQVAFAAVKLDRGHWTAWEVRPRHDAVRSYGQFKKVSSVGDSGPYGVIRPHNRALMGGGDAEISKRAFHQRDQKNLDRLRDGEWVVYLALEKSMLTPRGPRTAVAIHAEVPWIPGLVVKRTNDAILIWCAEVGLATGEASSEWSLAVGQWVRFRLGAQNTTDGHWKAFNVNPIQAPADVLVKVGRHIRVTALATAGVLVPRFGTVWCEKLGRMSVWRWCLKNVDIRHHQRVVVRAFYHISDDRRADTHGDAWTVYQLKAAPATSKVSAFTPSPSIIYGVKAVIEEICFSTRKWYSSSSLPPCYWRLRSERYGTVIARPVDVLPIVSDEEDVVLVWPKLKPGDEVTLSMHAVSLSHFDEYRAFVVEVRRDNVVESKCHIERTVTFPV